MAKKAILIVLAEYEDDVRVKRSGLDDDADGYMYELFGDATGNYESSIDGAVIAAPDDMTLEQAKQLITGVSD